MIPKAPDLGGLFSAQRIVVTGANGAGKTRVAKEIAQKTGHSIVHMDALKLTAAWQIRDPLATQADLIAAAQQENWIIEGGPSCLIPQVVDLADAILWLRPAHHVRLWRILRRSWLMRGKTRPELPANNPESFDGRALRFAWRSWRNSTAFDAKIAAALEGYAPIIWR